MEKLTAIMDMLDWHMPQEIQLKGRILAKKIENIEPFLQPLTIKYHKNVWENCAIIIEERKDDELKPYLTRLLEWLQDMNWPGSFCIFDRLLKYTDMASFQLAYEICMKKAYELNDETWVNNLKKLTDMQSKTTTPN